MLLQQTSNIYLAVIIGGHNNTLFYFTRSYIGIFFDKQSGCTGTIGVDIDVPLIII